METKGEMHEPIGTTYKTFDKTYDCLGDINLNNNR